jgi:hypothetical protein
MTSTFWLTRPSMSVSCLAAEPCASVEMYLLPAASTTALIAASSVFQRSSWKVFQETAMVLPAAIADMDDMPSSRAPAIIVKILRFIVVVLLNSLPNRGTHSLTGVAPGNAEPGP